MGNFQNYSKTLSRSLHQFFSRVDQFRNSNPQFEKIKNDANIQTQIIPDHNFVSTQQIKHLTAEKLYFLKQQYSRYCNRCTICNKNGAHVLKYFDSTILLTFHVYVERFPHFCCVMLVFVVAVYAFENIMALNSK